MAAIAYHASQEQFAPSELLRLAKKAEEAGFDAIHSSDHFHPWSVRQGHSGFTFSWIGAAMQQSKLPFSMVCAPGQRYHPAIVAQAIATLGEMFPGRFSVELGSGEALNEMITGTPWPEKNIRNERLKECADIIRRLLQGEEVTFNGHVKVREAKLYSLPAEKPKLFCAALSEPTSKWAGSWADGLLTTSGELDDTNKKIKAFHDNGGKGKPVYLQFSFSYARKKDDAIDGAYDQWRSTFVGTEKLAALYKPEQFDETAKGITRDEVAEKLLIISNVNELGDHIKKLESTGAEKIVLHNLNRLHDDFIEDYGKRLA
jgi:coenzyme F420-dependent glucose-6-phosphate dehydrogenase